MGDKKEPEKGISEEVLNRIDKYFSKFDTDAKRLDPGAAEAINSLLAQAKQYRDQYKADQEELATLRDKVKALDAYKELGDDPAKLKEALEAGTKATTDLAEIAKKKELDEIAKAMNWKPDVLAQLKTLTPDIAFEISTINVKAQDGTTTPEKVVHVIGSDKVKVEASEFIEKNNTWSTFKEALVVTDQEQKVTQPRVPSQRSSQQTRPTGKQVDEKDIRTEQSTRLHAHRQF